jgi:3D (Asp-Asp-Asp) domain-containing protein
VAETGDFDPGDEDGTVRFEPPKERGQARSARFEYRTIGGHEPDRSPEEVARRVAVAKTEGHDADTFRNTYYHFPSERDYIGESTPIFDASCHRIADVPKEFHDALCVQGSGLLSRGMTVSFAKRDCECAHVCPKTNQQICFEALTPERFPWGRGAMGTAIVPLLTVAVDSAIIPLGTPIYIPEYDGMPRDLERSSFHDGCFIAQDRGLRVKGRHVDVFTGETRLTQLWNKLVPTNKGVTVILNSPRCARGQ